MGTWRNCPPTGELRSELETTFERTGWPEAASSACNREDLITSVSPQAGDGALRATSSLTAHT